MGGENSMVNFVQKKWAAQDHTHIRYPGGKYIAQRFATALVYAAQQHPGAVEFIKTVAGQMAALLEYQYTPAQLAGHAFGHHGTGEASTNNNRLNTHAALPKS